jgi:hypothetical protein
LAFGDKNRVANVVDSGDAANTTLMMTKNKSRDILVGDGKGDDDKGDDDDGLSLSLPCDDDDILLFCCQGHTNCYCCWRCRESCCLWWLVCQDAWNERAIFVGWRSNRLLYKAIDCFMKQSIATRSNRLLRIAKCMR